MPFAPGNEFRIKPKHTEEDLTLIREMVRLGRKDNEIFLVLMGERPDVSPRSIERWIQKVRKELDTPAQA